MIRKNFLKLLEITKENPNLPILPLVNGGMVVPDDSIYWCGSWGTPRIRYFIYQNRKFIFKNCKEGYEFLYALKSLTELFGEDFIENLTKKDIFYIFDRLPWMEAIVIDINMLSENLNNSENLYCTKNDLRFFSFEESKNSDYRENIMKKFMKTN